MLIRVFSGTGAIVAVAVPIIVLVGCDPRTAAMDLFARKGLNLLSPARDYVQPGGLVFVAKGAPPVYEDPADNPQAEQGNLTDFRADILEESIGGKSTLSAALALGQSVLPVSFSADLGAYKNVSLKQISTTGRRLNTSALDTLINRPNTLKRVMRGLDSKLRVFMVQEIYRAKTLELTSASTTGFGVRYVADKPVTDCKPDSGAGASPPTQGSAVKKTAGSNQKDAGTTASTSKEKGAASATSKASDGISGIQAGLSACMADNYTLKLTDTEPIPFAVRLAELEISGNTIRRKIGSRVITTSLGGPSSQVAASLVAENSPVLEEMVRRP